MSMNVIIDFSFHDESFLFPLIKKIESETVVKSIKYALDFEWFELEKSGQLQSKKFNELNLETELFGAVYFQFLENSLPRVFVPEIDLFRKDKFIQIIEDNFLNLICFGKVCESIDSILQNIETPDSWRRKKRQIPEYAELFPNPIYTNEREKELVSLESMPGHYHVMSYDERLWFGSCWQMYFSSVYLKFIPKFLFDNFSNCHENRVLENGVRRIVLFPNPEEYDLPESRSKQWSFRRELGIDTIAHELTKQNNRIEPHELPVIISKKNCTKGTTKVILFQRDKVIEREFLDDGITLVLEEIKTI